jgi:hypothetical protein
MTRNVGTADRLIRAFVLAPAAIVWAGVAGWTGVWAIVALAIAAVMLATAAVGFCPLYALLGFDTTGRRRAVHA